MLEITHEPADKPLVERTVITWNRVITVDEAQERAERVESDYLARKEARIRELEAQIGQIRNRIRELW